ncbi:MAG: hypothetical protein ACM3UZ_12070 [Acidobacteriota bacterium]
MKKYMKPNMNFVKLTMEERFAGSTGNPPQPPPPPQPPVIPDIPHISFFFWGCFF